MEITNIDSNAKYDYLPEHVILFTDLGRHIAAHAIKGPCHKYCGYMECSEKLICCAYNQKFISWPINGTGSASALPGRIKTAFRDTVIVGWDYEHPGYPEDPDWNNLDVVLVDCLQIYQEMIVTLSNLSGIIN